jgi:hypothetical protein
LASLFIVCQSIFAEEEFKLLLSLAHQIFIYFSGTGGTKLAQHIRQFFFVNAELKEYFKNIISFAERNKNIVLFELNKIARKDKPHFLAISGFENIFDQESGDENNDNNKKSHKISVKKPTVIFPHLHKQHQYEKMFYNNETKLEGIDPATLPRGSYLLVKAENVTSKEKNNSNPNSDETDCEKDWNLVNDVISNDIETGLPYNKQQKAKNLAKSILNSKFFCITDKGKAIMIKDQPKTKAPLLDFLNAATRSSGPNEVSDLRFIIFTKYLLKSLTPQSHFKNKCLMNAALNKKIKKIKTQI